MVHHIMHIAYSIHRNYMSKWIKGNLQGLTRNEFIEWKYSKNELKLKAGTKKEMLNKRYVTGYTL